MAKKAKNEGWVYVIVRDPGKDESFLGIHNEERDIQYIPAFETKEGAQECFLDFPREKGKKYEIQAVHIEDLRENADKSGFLVAVVDAKGEIIE